jgi:RNA ligase
MLSTGANFNDLLEVVPDEFFQKVKDVKEELENQFSSIKQKSITIANDVKNFPDRKSIAVHLLNNHKDIMSVVFGLLDNKDVDKIIWKMIQPDFEKI